MDHIPVELISMIAAQLLQEDFVDEPSARLIRTTVDMSGIVGGWSNFCENVRPDICNFRLVNRKFHDSSFASFGNILGHRAFRITKVGLEDLQAISSIARLRPHIRTLAFGTARFGNLPETVLPGLLDVISEPDQARMRVAYFEAYRWQEVNRGSRYAQEVAPLLARLPHLQALSVFLSDYAAMDAHLGGWLGPGDAGRLSEAFTKYYPPHVVSANIYHLYDKDLTVLAPLFDALAASKTSIRDLRIGPQVSVRPIDINRILRDTSMLSNLTHLRFDTSPSDIGDSYTHTSLCFYKPVMRLTNVTHLTLGMVGHRVSEHYADATRNLLNLLSLLKRPQHLVIRGIWEYSEDDLIRSMSAHSKSLNLLSLKGAVMAAGNWTSTVRRLVQLPIKNLKISRYARVREQPA